MQLMRTRSAMADLLCSPQPYGDGLKDRLDGKATLTQTVSLCGSGSRSYGCLATEAGDISPGFFSVASVGFNFPNITD